MNFVFIFIFIFKRTFNALFSSDRNCQTIHKQFRLIFIFNHRNGVNFIFRSDFLSLRFFSNISRNLSRFFKKLIFNFNTFCFENIKQFFFLNFNEIESSFHYLRSFLRLSQEISKSLHFRIDDIYLIMYDMIIRSNYVASATLLFDLFAHANDTTDVFN